IQEVVGLACQKLKGILTLAVPGGMARLLRRDEGGYRIQALQRELLAAKFGLAAGSGESPIGKRQETAAGTFLGREIQAHMTVALQPPAIDAGEPWVSRTQSSVDHLVHRLAETIIGKAHAQRQRAEQLHVGAGLAHGLDGLV